MTRLNHSRPILKLLSAKRRGLATSGLVKKYLPTAPKQPSNKPRQSAGDRDQMHEVAVAILDHIDQYGDYTDAEKLAEFARNEPERDALREWFTRYSKIGYDPRKKKFYFSKHKVSDRASAVAHPFWTLKAPPKRRTVHFTHQLIKLITAVREQGAKADAADRAIVDDIEEVLKSHGIHLLAYKDNDR